MMNYYMAQEEALLEVSPCTFPAYDSSEISCRSFEKVKEEAKEEKAILCIGSGTVQDHGKEPESRNGQGSGRYI